MFIFLPISLGASSPLHYAPLCAHPPQVAACPAAWPSGSPDPAGQREKGWLGPVTLQLADAEVLMNMNGPLLHRAAPSDSFTPRRARKGYSELNVNHIFTGMNQTTVSLSHNRDFNHTAAPGGFCSPVAAPGRSAPPCGCAGWGCPGPGKGRRAPVGVLTLVCRALWCPGHGCPCISHQPQSRWARQHFTC